MAQHGPRITALCLPLTLMLQLTGLLGNEVQVPPSVTAVLGKNITLGCRVEVGPNLSLTQSSWERKTNTGTITLAIFNPMYGISIAEAYRNRLYFPTPSEHDATVVLEDVSFSDSGLYTCKVATFPLGNTQASTTVTVMVEPKVYVSAGSAALVDEGNETVVATCTAERGRPAAEVSWESALFGHSDVQSLKEPNGTTTTQVRYLWRPTRRVQGHTLTCVVRHPALQTEFRIPYQLNVQFAPDVTVTGSSTNWFVGRQDAQLRCQVTANPPARNVHWSRLDGAMPDGVEIKNGTMLFTRALRRNDSGVYSCEAVNDIGSRSREMRIWVREPPPTTVASITTPALFPPNMDPASHTVPTKRRAQLSSPTAGSTSDSSLGTIVGGVVGGVLFLVLLLVLGGTCYMRQRRTFRGDYYTKQYLGPADMQKEPQLDVLQPHELKEVYGGGDSGKDSPDLKPKPCGEVIHQDYSERKDREEWGDGVRNSRRMHRPDGYYPNHHSPPNMHPREMTIDLPPMHNGSPYMSDDYYDNGTDNDYVSHLDGSVISRREWYV